MVSRDPGHEAAPLASYVLRVKGRPATLVFELQDVRTGRRRRFSQAAALVVFLAQHGLSLDLHVLPGPTGSDEPAGR
jgi:hypothetical protein